MPWHEVRSVDQESVIVAAMIDQCPNCKQPRPGGKSGSLTQWIFVCHCSSITAEAPAEALDAFRFQICRKCRKRIGSGRDGSLTQFVFRSDICRCELPESLDVAVARPRLEFEQQEEGLAQSFGEDQGGLDLPSDSFPTSRFKPLRELGRGASGAVYLCIDRLLGTKVAVKTLHYLSSDQLLNFQQEARAISRLSHPKIVKILDFGATDCGIPYMVLEYIEGIDLESFAVQSDRKIPLGEILEIVVSICDALSYSHAKEIYHRDLKPSNILIVRNHGLSAKLVDFGVARVKFEALEPTICNGTTVIGTPTYMSPDQMRGISYDQRSEIYSLGCILYELVSGKPPYSAETVMELVTLHANAPIPSLKDTKAGNDFPEKLDVIVKSCLAKMPEDRYQSIEALKNDLESLRSTEASSSDFLLGQDDGDEAADARKMYTSAVLNQAYNQNQTSPSPKGVTQRSGTIAMVVAALLIVGSLAGLSALFLSTPQGKDESAEKRAGELADALLETKFNVNEFNGNFWLFNMAPVNDDCIPELLKSKHNRLWIDAERREGISPAALLKLKPKKVVAFALINVRLTPAHLDALVELKTIKALRLFANPEFNDESLAHIKGMHNLEELFIRCPAVTDNGISQLAGMQNLKILSLDRCTRLTDKCLDTIEKMKDLERISLAETRVSKAGILRVTKMKNLDTISLCGLPCDQECLKEIEKMNLVRLSLRQAPLSGADVMPLSQVKPLKLLDVRDIEGFGNIEGKEFYARRQAKKLPVCQVIWQRKSGTQAFGEMVYETLDDEHMWTD